jgi:hypothetical protein
MNTRDMIIELWELAGEPSDLDPFYEAAPTTTPDQLDPASAGVAHYLREISNAQVMLSNWKTSRGRAIRFKKFFNQRNVKVGRTDEIDMIQPVGDTTTMRISVPPVWLNPNYLDTARLELVWTG